MLFRVVEDSSSGLIEEIEAETREEALEQILSGLGYRLEEIESEEEN